MTSSHASSSTPGRNGRVAIGRQPVRGAASSTGSGRRSWNRSRRDVSPARRPARRPPASARTPPIARRPRAEGTDGRTLPRRWRDRDTEGQGPRDQRTAEARVPRGRAASSTTRNAFQLLAATILSAQTTDVRVNMVTPALFARYPTAEDLAAADPAEVEEIIKSTGFFRNKTKSIIGMAQALVERFGGEVPGRDGATS